MGKKVLNIAFSIKINNMDQSLTEHTLQVEGVKRTVKVVHFAPNDMVVYYYNHRIMIMPKNKGEVVVLLHNPQGKQMWNEVYGINLYEIGIIKAVGKIVDSYNSVYNKKKRRVIH